MPKRITGALGMKGTAVDIRLAEIGARCGPISEQTAAARREQLHSHAAAASIFRADQLASDSATLVRHWSGAAHRLARDLSGSFGSKKHAQEELVAEMGAAFLCASLGIVPTVRRADYIGSWLDLRQNKRATICAASAASKAADYLLAFRSDRTHATCKEAESLRPLQE